MLSLFMSTPSAKSNIGTSRVVSGPSGGVRRVAIGFITRFPDIGGNSGSIEAQVLGSSKCIVWKAPETHRTRVYNDSGL